MVPHGNPHGDSPKSLSTADLHWGQPPHINRSFQKMLLHPGFAFYVLLSFLLLYDNPAAVVLDYIGTVPVGSYEHLGCFGEKM